MNKQDHLVCIHPDKEVRKLTVKISGHDGPSYFIRVDFTKNHFYFFEWNLEAKLEATTKRKLPLIAGDIETFKKQLYLINLWDWDVDYQLKGIILDGTCWSVKLETKTKIYKSKGLESFPYQWPMFYRSLTKLVGIDFL